MKNSLVEALSTSHEFGPPDWRWATLDSQTYIVMRLHETIQIEIATLNEFGPLAVPAETMPK